MSATSTDAYTGKRVRVLTKAQVRYEGTVLKIDKKERALHLQNVKQFGTEGRRGGVNEIPAQENVLEEILFRINLVENFFIIPDAPEEEKVAP